MSTGPRADAPVRLDLVSKRGKSGVVGYLKIAYDPPDTWPPKTITISVEEAPGPSVDARAAASEMKVLDALESLPMQPAASGKPGLSRIALVVATKLGDRTVQRTLDRLIALGMVGVTGALTTHAKLFARTSNARV
jgi:hypothetical protein